MRMKLDLLKASTGSRVRVYYPWDTPPKILIATGDVRKVAKETPAPSNQEWEFYNTVTQMREWVPGWYIGTPLKLGEG